MTRRKPRITNVDEADASVAKLAWLRSVGHPKVAVAELFEAYATVRAELHRTQQLLDGQGTGHFQRMLKK